VPEPASDLGAGSPVRRASRHALGSRLQLLVLLIAVAGIVSVVVVGLRG
jgi:hypothetical protein